MYILTYSSRKALFDDIEMLSKNIGGEFDIHLHKLFVRLRKYDKAIDKDIASKSLACKIYICKELKDD